MQLDLLQIQGLRSLSDFSFAPAEKFNYLCGPNGVGKTSVLEAIYMLGRGRSFRSRRVSSLIQYGEKKLVVYAQMHNQSQAYKVGVSKAERVAMQMQLDGEKLASVNPLVEAFPSLLINAESFQLLCGEPENRRRLLDWGMFHVEHHFFQVWRGYYQVLKQRNALLQQASRSNLSAWNAALIEKAKVLSDMRAGHVDTLLSLFRPLCAQWLNIPNIEVTYSQGWDENLTFEEALAAKEPLDRARGFTQVGPHRADIKITLQGAPAKDLLSRGQQKLLILLLNVAQYRLLETNGGKFPFILVDDFAAELDVQAQAKVLELLAQLPGQVFLTGIEEAFWEQHKGLLDPQGKMFHVEHCITIPQ